MEKIFTFILMFLASIFLLENTAEASEVPVYHGIPAYQQKDIFGTERVKISGITVNEITGTEEVPLTKPVCFEIFNSTKQETEYEIVSENGKLSDLNLVKDHNYIIFAKDSEYQMENVYLWIRNGVPVNIKEIGDANNPSYSYPEVKSLSLQKREEAVQTLEEDKRVMTNLPVRFGEGTVFNVKMKLVSAFETVETTSGNKGYLRVELLEDIPYMLYIEHETYGLETFPLVVKDKSEYGAGKYTYDFSSCKRVEEIQLVKKADEHKNDTTVKGLYGKMSISGMNFKDFLLIDKTLDIKLEAKPNGNTYEVLSAALVNPHRWEIGKFPVGNFKLTVSDNTDAQIKSIYIMESEDMLREIPFDRDGQTVSFTMESISMYPIVLGIEKKEAEPPKQPEKTELAAPKTAKAELSGGYDDVKFSWSKVTGASGYYVYYKKSTAKKYTSLGTTTKLYYTKKNLADGVKYQFKVVPYYTKSGKKVQGKYAKTANVYTLKKLAAPKVSKYSKTKVKVSWGNISGESGYQISRSTSKKGTKIISTYSTTTGKSKIFSPQRKKTYYYKVRAYKTVGGKKIYGPWSSVKSYKLK